MVLSLRGPFEVYVSKCLKGFPSTKIVEPVSTVNVIFGLLIFSLVIGGLLCVTFTAGQYSESLDSFCLDVVAGRMFLLNECCYRTLTLLDKTLTLGLETSGTTDLGEMVCFLVYCYSYK